MSICHAMPLDDRGYVVPCGANISPFRPNAEADGGSAWSDDLAFIECEACRAIVKGEFVMGLNLNAQCNHLVIEEIRNGADEIIGRRCNVCVTVLSGIGKCHGCKKDKAELRYVAGEQRYCDKDCRAAELKEKREQEGSQPVK